METHCLSGISSLFGLDTTAGRSEVQTSSRVFHSCTTHICEQAMVKVKIDKMGQHLDDLEFIYVEVTRFAKMSFQELKTHFERNKADGLCTIPHPSGRGELICGLQAYDKFLQIAKRHLTGFPDLQKQIETEELKRALIRDFVNRFLKRQADINAQSVNKMLAAALKRVKQKRQDLTHYIPCIICEDRCPAEFNVGPVHFSLMERFFSKGSSEFESERQRIYSEHRAACQKAIENGMPEKTVATPEASRGLADGLVEGVLTYFSDFPWVAEVTIPQCSETVSRMRAELAVEGALNVLRVLIGEDYAKKMMQGAPPASRTKAGALMKNNSTGVVF